MEFIEKAALAQNKKTVNIIIITIIASISMVGFALSVYSIVRSEVLYFLLYIVAALIGISYVVIKINSVIPPYIAVTEDKLYIECWENGVFPYDTSFKPSFFADFIPAKVRKKEIPINSIDTLYVGSKNYLVRNLEDTTFSKDIYNITKYRRIDMEYSKKMDFICVKDKNNNISFMTIEDIDRNSLVSLISYIHEKNEEIEIKCNLRDIRMKLAI